MRRLCSAILVSLLMHFVAANLLRMRFVPEVREVQVEFRERERPQALLGKGGPAHVRRAPVRNLEQLAWKDLLPTQGTSGTKASIGNNGLLEEEWGSQGGSLKELEHTSKYQRLFVEIQGLLNYPGRLGEHGISGTINSRIFFTERSRCDWSKSRISGAHPYLRFYTLALLKKLCALENIKHIGFAKNQFVDLSFAFLLTETGESQREQQAREFIQGNVLSFYRSYPHSSLEYRLGPLRGYWFAPVISINFPWIFENWEKYVQGKDPMADFR